MDVVPEPAGSAYGEKRFFTFTLNYSYIKILWATVIIVIAAISIK